MLIVAELPWVGVGRDRVSKGVAAAIDRCPKTARTLAIFTVGDSRHVDRDRFAVGGRLEVGWEELSLGEK